MPAFAADGTVQVHRHQPGLGWVGAGSVALLPLGYLTFNVHVGPTGHLSVTSAFAPNVTGSLMAAAQPLASQLRVGVGMGMVVGLVVGLAVGRAVGTGVGDGRAVAGATLDEGEGSLDAFGEIESDGSTVASGVDAKVTSTVGGTDASAVASADREDSTAAGPGAAHPISEAPTRIAPASARQARRPGTTPLLTSPGGGSMSVPGLRGLPATRRFSLFPEIRTLGWLADGGLLQRDRQAISVDRGADAEGQWDVRRRVAEVDVADDRDVAVANDVQDDL